MEPILQLSQTLRLGLIDQDNFTDFQKNRSKYFEKLHKRLALTFKKTDKRLLQFRGEGDNEWVEPKAIIGKDIKALQTFLQTRGFLPGDSVDGIFGYRTLSAVRLFQEYIRTIEGIDIGVADGRVGNGTHRHMMRWTENDHYAEWGPDRASVAQEDYQWSTSSAEYEMWMNLLPKVKASYLKALEDTSDLKTDANLFQLQEVRDFPKKSNTLKIDDWSFNRDDIHLIGLRCFHEESRNQRGNDDLFVLLMNGMVFKFWGSTDPKPATTKDGLEPYLVEGQHKYAFSWHRVSTEDGKRVYKALIPFNLAGGVLVNRDWSGKNNLTEADIFKGLQFNPTGKPSRGNPNSTINVHWTADGKSNWSAGCQVISGRSYINNRGDLVDCSAFSASAYSSVSAVSRPGVRLNRGAYTFLEDFVFAYAKKNHVMYMLGRDGAVEEFAEPEMLNLLNEQLAITDQAAQLGGEAAIHQMVKKMVNV